MTIQLFLLNWSVPCNTFGQAVQYCLNQWENLTNETKLRLLLGDGAFNAKFTFGLPGNLKARRPTKEGADRSCLYPSNRYSVAAQRDR